MHLIINQDTLIKEIAQQEELDLVTVRDVLKCTEEVIFHVFSSTPPTEDVVIKLLNGVSIERTYVDKKEYTKGLFQNIVCQPHVKTKANLSKHYNKRLNERLFRKQII